MTVTLNLSSSELDDESLQALTRELCDSIANETDIKAEILLAVRYNKVIKATRLR